MDDQLIRLERALNIDPFNEALFEQYLRVAERSGLVDYNLDRNIEEIPEYEHVQGDLRIHKFRKGTNVPTLMWHLRNSEINITKALALKALGDLKSPVFARTFIQYLRESQINIRARFSSPMTRKSSEEALELLGFNIHYGKIVDYPNSDYLNVFGMTLEIFENIISEEYKGLDRFDLHENYSGDIVLNAIIMKKEYRKKGIGTEIMERLTQYADEVGKRILLLTSDKTSGWGTTSRARLRKFYKRFGFVHNKGRNKDFSISENMYRRPNQ
jgi:GNAT superfamily N-acetyltransferase